MAHEIRETTPRQRRNALAPFFVHPLSRLTSRWRIFYEESADSAVRAERSDFEELRGAGNTRIYRHGQETLAVSCETQRYAALSRIPGLIPKSGCVLLFPDGLLDTVAEAIHAKHRRQLSAEQIADLTTRIARARLSRKQVDTSPFVNPKTDERRENGLQAEAGVLAQE